MNAFDQGRDARPFGDSDSAAAAGSESPEEGAEAEQAAEDARTDG